MTTNKSPNHCVSCPAISRRTFLASGCAACAAGMGLLATRRAVYAQTEQPLRLRVVYALHAEVQPVPDWPNIGFDFRPMMRKIESALTEAMPRTEFLFSQAANEEQAAQLLAEDATQNVSGYVVVQMNCWNRVVQPLVASGKPVLYADFLFAGSGGFLVYTAAFLRTETPNLGFIASSRMDDFVQCVKCFEKIRDGAPASDFGKLVAQARIASTAKAGDLSCTQDPVDVLSPAEWRERIRETKIIAFMDEQAREAPPILGISVQYLPFAELNEAWQNADRDEARNIVARWKSEAQRIEDVPEDVLVDSAAMYLAERAILQRHNANAITINCLGGFYGNHIHAYPCMGFFELNNQGLIGACECDLRSTATMVAMTTLTKGRPGYISDPVMDTARRQIIYAHCVSTNRVFGPQGSTNAYEILTHSEDRKGASVRSVLPTGYMTTTLQVSPETKEILFHQAKAVGNDPEDRACRTKLCAEPIGDFEKLFREWDRWGWHRVTFYGDLKESVFALAEAEGWKIVEEA